VVWAETLGGSELLQCFEIFSDVFHILVNMSGRRAVRSCPTDRSGEEECTVDQLCSVFVNLGSRQGRHTSPCLDSKQRHGDVELET